MRAAFPFAWVGWTFFSAVLLAAPPKPEDYFQIEVLDADTGRGVPLVELRTVHNVRYLTDSAGNVAFFEPGLMDQSVFFFVESHGYEFPEDGFGYRGARLKTTPGGQATLKIKRLNLAERLYRVTGAGSYRDTVLLGQQPPLDEPLLNGRVFGSDSVVNAVFRGKIYWFWGDTNRPSYPLGNFHVPGATSLLPSQGGLDPNRGVNLSYFTEESGFAKPTAKMPGKGPTWINSLVVLKDKAGNERMFAKYVKVEPPLTVYERGLVEFNDQTKAFEKRLQFDEDEDVFPSGHPFHHTTGGVEHVYFASPYPFVRAPATAEAFLDSSQYEVYTCLASGASADSPQLDRDADGRLKFAWKRNAPLLTQKLQKRLIQEGALQPEERLYRLQDVETGKAVTAHSGSVYWNDYRQRWIMIFVESYGSSLLGEVWLSEAASPTGPWEHARKIVTHNKYSFYNPKQHPMFDQQGGRVIFLEGTYTNTFSGNPDRTPRYNYNQIMYKLDLADPRLKFPGR